MAQCLINDRPESLDFGPKTWGELLHRLDARLASDRRVVTAVRFDGVDQPSFREPGTTVRALDAIARVDVDAEEASALLTASLDAATDSLPALVCGVRLTAAALRSGDPDAHLHLSALVAALQSLVALTAATATAADLTHGTTCGADAELAHAGLALGTVLTTIIEQQTRGDGPALAATLDAHLAPIVAGWSDVLAPMRRGVAA
jgi:hypothetical protein